MIFNDLYYSNFQAHASLLLAIIYSCLYKCDLLQEIRIHQMILLFRKNGIRKN